MTGRIAALARTSAPARSASLAAVLALLFALPLWLLLGGRASAPLPAASTASGRDTLANLPIAAQGPVSAALGAADPAYRAVSVPGGVRASSPAQGLDARFSSAGVQLSSGPARVSLSVRGIGYGASVASLAAVAPSASANRILYARAGLSEWYANGPLGLEQGFTVARSPAAAADAGPLTLAISLTGNVHAALAAHGTTLLLSRAGHTALRYGGLVAVEAHGRALHSWLELQGATLLLRVDARGAAFPLRIDPLVGGERISAPGEESEGGYFGRNVAMTPDGTTAVIGGPHDVGNLEAGDRGAVWVFTRTGNTWTQQGTKITPHEEDGQARFGQSVAISADGNTAIVGGYANDVAVGAVWVFTRSDGAWMQQGPSIIGGEHVGKSSFGESVALSADGNTALVGGGGDNEGAGAAWVLTRSTEGVWMQQGSKLTGGAEAGAGQFGQGVALSADGNTALVGGPGDAGGVGAAWAFTRSGGAWTQQGTKLTGTEEIAEGQFGVSVALSGDGNTALVGGYSDNGKSGAAWAYTRTGGVWSQQGPKLTGGSGAYFGLSVALSANGEVALVGGPRDHAKVGAAWEFVDVGGIWTQEGSKLLGTEGAPGAAETAEEIEEGAFGRSVAISADGTRALVGAPRDLELNGAVWVFVQPPPAVLSTKPNGVTMTDATFHGTVNPEGRSVTDCHFEYGTARYENSVPCNTTPGAQSKPVPVSASVSGLRPGSVYRFRAVASNAAGAGYGGEWTFSTQLEAGSGTSPQKETEGETPPPKETGTIEVSAFRAVSFGSRAGSGSAHGTTGSGANCVVSLASSAATVPGARNVAVKLRSKGSFAGACKGTLRLALKVRKGSKLKSATVASGGFSIFAGRTRWVHIKLNTLGRTLLGGAHGPLRGTLLILNASPGHARTTTATVRLPRH